MSLSVGAEEAAPIPPHGARAGDQPHRVTVGAVVNVAVRVGVAVGVAGAVRVAVEVGVDVRVFVGR